MIESAKASPRFLFSLVVFFGLLFAFVGCYDAVNYKVTFESEGEVVASVVVAKGSTFPAEQVPANPEKEGEYLRYAQILKHNKVDYDVFASSWYPYPQRISYLHP